jgi:hypothetical protein
LTMRSNAYAERWVRTVWSAVRMLIAGPRHLQGGWLPVKMVAHTALRRRPQAGLRRPYNACHKPSRRLCCVRKYYFRTYLTVTPTTARLSHLSRQPPRLGTTARAAYSPLRCTLVRGQPGQAPKWKTSQLKRTLSPRTGKGGPRVQPSICAPQALAYAYTDTKLL